MAMSTDQGRSGDGFVMDRGSAANSSGVPSVVVGLPKAAPVLFQSPALKVMRATRRCRWEIRAARHRVIGA